MDAFLKDLLSNAPPSMAAVVIVYLFLQFSRDTFKAQRAMLEAVINLGMVAKKDLQEVITENAVSTRENTKAIQSLEHAVKNLAPR